MRRRRRKARQSFNVLAGQHEGQLLAFESPGPWSCAPLCMGFHQHDEAEATQCSLLMARALPRPWELAVEGGSGRGSMAFGRCCFASTGMVAAYWSSIDTTNTRELDA
mmetsp:Transcript_22696/g.63032  ORF Transcript_22696/g.63032 Transcript_22696/m.63032 type:complete len:108 (+) Transcript_22696:1538-1861(+)